MTYDDDLTLLSKNFDHNTSIVPTREPMLAIFTPGFWWNVSFTLTPSYKPIDELEIKFDVRVLEL